MQDANDPNIDYKALVKAGYDHCASNYAEQRDTGAPQELRFITERLAPKSTILDVGCGAGTPVAKHLAVDYSVTGVDLSSRMIDMAKTNVPTARFVETDIMAAEFPTAHFDAIVSFYALFHLPRQEHETLFQNFANWLKSGGLLLVSLARKDDGPGYTEDDFHGVTMYWSNFGLEAYRDIVQRAGFRIEQEGIVGHGYNNPQPSEEIHPFIFCTRADDTKSG